MRTSQEWLLTVSGRVVGRLVHGGATVKYPLHVMPTH